MVRLGRNAADLAGLAADPMAPGQPEIGAAASCSGRQPLTGTECSAVTRPRQDGAPSGLAEPLGAPSGVDSSPRPCFGVAAGRERFEVGTLPSAMSCIESVVLQ